MKRKKPIEYFYTIQNISNDNTTAYQATIPAFNNSIVFGESLEELEEGIRLAIETGIDIYNKKGRPIPPPDLEKKFSGKFILRIDRRLHAKLSTTARANGQSLNRYVYDQLKKIHS